MAPRQNPEVPWKAPPGTGEFSAWRRGFAAKNAGVSPAGFAQEMVVTFLCDGAVPVAAAEIVPDPLDEGVAAHGYALGPGPTLENQSDQGLRTRRVRRVAATWASC